MKKIIISLLLTFLISITVYSQTRLEKHIVAIFSLSDKFKVRNCSGIVIEQTNKVTKVLTCKHCLGLTEEVKIENKDVGLIIASPNEDLALMIVKGKMENKEVVKFAKNLSKIGDKITVVGYPKFKLYKKTGRIIESTKDYQWAKVKIVDGCSGGGVFNVDGELVGVVWGKYDLYGWGMFEPLQDIERFLKKIEEWK